MLAGRIVVVLAIAGFVAGGVGNSWRALGLDVGKLEIGLYSASVCGDCGEVCQVRHRDCLADAVARYGACDKADCKLVDGKTVCSSSGCKQEGHCETVLHRCKAKCVNQPACASSALFDAGTALQLGPRDRHLMALAGLAGLGTLAVGALAAILLAITAIRPRRVLATVALVVSAIALGAGAAFVIASGMKSPVGGTSIEWSAIAWLVGGVAAIVGAVLLRRPAEG